MHQSADYKTFTVFCKIYVIIFALFELRIKMSEFGKITWFLRIQPWIMLLTGAEYK